MKLSRTSEEHRNRRNRQMAEAQRLLDHSCIPNNDTAAVDQLNIGGDKSERHMVQSDGANLTDKDEDALFEAPRLINSPTTHVPRERRDEKQRYRSRAKDSQGNQQYSSPIRSRHSQESPQQVSHSHSPVADMGTNVDGEDSMYNP